MTVHFFGSPKKTTVKIKQIRFFKIRKKINITKNKKTMVSVMLKRATRLTTALAIVLPAPFASADFLKDAKGSLELRNFY